VRSSDTAPASTREHQTTCGAISLLCKDAYQGCAGYSPHLLTAAIGGRTHRLFEVCGLGTCDGLSGKGHMAVSPPLYIMTSPFFDCNSPLVFYVGSIPFFSLLYIVAHLAALQFNGLPSPPYLNSRGPRSSSRLISNAQPYDAHFAVSTTFFVFCFSILYSLAWLAQSILCTSCELAPILKGTQGNVPKWCPQSRFRDSRDPSLPGMLGTLATVKDILQWVMFGISLMLIECGRREYVRAQYVANATIKLLGAGVDFGGPSQGTAGFNLPSKEAAISGPQLVYRAEEEARRKAEEAQRRQADEERRRKNGLIPHFATTGPNPQSLPIGPGAPGTKDNYYGNGMLKRSNTLNYMYDTRVAGPDGTKTSTPTDAGQPSPPPPPPPAGGKDNVYGNATTLRRGGSLARAGPGAVAGYESRLAGIAESPNEDPSIPRPLNIRKSRPNTPAAPGMPSAIVGYDVYNGQRNVAAGYESRI
jgi:hypothetical protein